MKPFSAIGTVVLGVSIITAAPAWAQTKEQKAGARAAADAGGDAFDAGKYAEAADLFERAERLVHAPPHLLYAARSHLKLGHLVEARELYMTLTREKLADSAPRVFKDAQNMGEKELADVEPRLSYVTIAVQGAPANSVRVTRNSDAVPAELLGIPTPINPGSYSYQAFAEGMESAATSVKLAEGARETVVLTLRAIPGYKKPGASGGPAQGSPGGQGSVGGSSLTDGPPSDAGASSGGRPLLIGAIAGFGVAVVGGGLGAYFLVKSGKTSDESEKKFSDCKTPPMTCSTSAQDEIHALDSDAATQKGVGIGGMIAGGVGLAAGVTLLILDAGRNHTASARVTPIVGLNYWGVAGRF